VFSVKPRLGARPFQRVGETFRKLAVCSLVARGPITPFKLNASQEDQFYICSGGTDKASVPELMDDATEPHL